MNQLKIDDLEPQNIYNMSEQFNFEYCQQQIFEEFQAGLLLQLKRSLSGDLFSGGFNIASNINNMVESTEKPRNLVFTMEQNSLTSNPEEKKSPQKRLTIFKKKLKKKRVKGECDYKKNICGYITKKILRQFTGPVYYQKVLKLCDEYECSYSKVKSYFLAQIEKVTGPSHIPSLIIPENEEQVPMKKAFQDFFVWFLNERYIRYLLHEGKMEQKIVYLKYKNETLAQILQESLSKV